MKLVEDMYVGYWSEKEKEKSLFLIPVPNSWRPSEEGKQDFLDWLTNFIEKRAKISKNKNGVACKICGKKLNSSEYSIEFMRNPQYFVYVHIACSFLHYVKVHNVRPPLNFFRTIRDREMKNIKNFAKEICKDTYIAVG